MLLAGLAIAVGVAAGPNVVQAQAASSCSGSWGQPVRHSGNDGSVFVQWTTEVVNNVQCSSNWYVHVRLEYESGGTWHFAQCEDWAQPPGNDACFIDSTGDVAGQGWNGNYDSPNFIYGGSCSGNTIFVPANLPKCTGEPYSEANIQNPASLCGFNLKYKLTYLFQNGDPEQDNFSATSNKTC